MLPSPFHLALIISLLVPAFLATPTKGCGRDMPSDQILGDPSFDMPFQQTNGRDRTYLIHIPTNYDQNTPSPLIFSFHGRTQNSSYQESLSGFSRDDWNPDAIVVYPQGIEDQWQGDPESVDVDDVAFVSEMIDLFSETYCLDSRRIYASGKSNGGGFVNVLACDANLSMRIAAFAPVSAAFYVPGSMGADCTGSIPQTVELPCTPGRNPIPIIEFHGLADQTIPYAGGPRRGLCLPSIQHWAEAWAERQGFGSEYISSLLYDGSVTKFEYAPNTPNQGIITHYAIVGLDHDWPNISPNADNANGTYLDATPLIVDFFNAYTL
ncbi:BgTH12-04641 [Blumeria graminis f. sp. triticale]|uniref:feruloyl esterase n=3 Tax=Blumeria graminis TaxID=34373 RepID=A0A9X9L7C9_BLUGR|nr:hypothetical protein BGT96224_1280 [Blumeria graminis f. sp. tritici 96224]CAD6498987.1 BgTH12-04641 [Blumeria graminis f. sp. triticale]VCU39119.1 Bgt-1280 [Blumeria graminis f. sp. tritici]